MKRRYVYVCCFIISIVLSVTFRYPVAATSMQVQPTLYRDSLQSKEKKRGYVDIANPSGQTITASFSVAAFRQTDDKGTLAFYDNEQVGKGVQLDFSSAEIKPRENLRLYFLLDGTKLPTGDVFAVIFATAENKTVNSVASARVGTLLALQNGTPGSHDAIIDEIAAPAIQIGEAIEASITVRNAAKEGQSTGFFPKLSISTIPYDSRSVDGPLIFAGRTRTITYRDAGNYIGPVKLSVKTGNSSKHTWLFVITGYWRWITPIVLLGIGGVLYGVARRNDRRFLKRTHRQ